MGHMYLLQAWDVASIELQPGLLCDWPGDPETKAVVWQDETRIEHNMDHSQKVSTQYPSPLLGPRVRKPSLDYSLGFGLSLRCVP